MGINLKNRKLWKSLTVMVLMFCIISMGKIKVQAGSVDIWMEVSGTSGQKEIQEGDTVEVSLILESSELMGGFEAFLSYDSDILEFLYSDGPVTGGDGYLRMRDLDPVKVGRDRTYTLYFSAVGAGKAKVQVEDPALVYPEDGGDSMEAAGEPLTFKVNPAPEASGINHLAELKVSPGELVPEFAPEINEYTMEVDEETTALVISALPEDEKATVTVTGNQDFVEGENLVEIIVKAENGDELRYQIVVQRKLAEEVEEKQEEKEEKDPVYYDPGFKMESGTTGFLFSGWYNYQVTAAPTTALSQLPDGYEPYTLNFYGEKIPAYREVTDDMSEEPRWVLLYVNAKDETAGFYEFDVQEKTMTRLKIREEEVEIINEITKDGNWVLYGVIAALAVFCAMLGMGLIMLLKGRR